MKGISEMIHFVLAADTIDNALFLGFAFILMGGHLAFGIRFFRAQSAFFLALKKVEDIPFLTGDTLSDAISLAMDRKNYQIMRAFIDEPYPNPEVEGLRKIMKRKFFHIALWMFTAGPIGFLLVVLVSSKLHSYI